MNTSRFRRQDGLTYVETIIATLILVVALVPAMDALHGALTGTRGHEAVVVASHRVTGRLEELLAETFQDIDAAAQAAGSETVPSSYSEPAGTPQRLVVYLARYDGDNADGNGDPFSGGDEGLLWVRVTIEDTPFAVETLLGE